MKNLWVFAALLTSILSACADHSDLTTEMIADTMETALVPQPKEISSATQTLVLSAHSKLYTSNAEVAPLLNLFQSELNTLTALSLDIAAN